MNDWPVNAWFNLAVRKYGIQPEQFWAMSLHEWLMLLRDTTPDVLTREGFLHLSQIYPDEDNHE